MKKITAILLIIILLLLTYNFLISPNATIQGVLNSVSTSSEPTKVEVSYYLDEFGMDLNQAISDEINKIKNSNAGYDYLINRVSDKNLANITIQKTAKFQTDSTSDSKEIQRLLPVTHFYNIFSNFDASKNYQIYCFENCSDIQALLDSKLIQGNLAKVNSSDELIKNLNGNENAITFLNPEKLDMNYKLLKIDDSYYLDDFKNYFSISYEITNNTKVDLLGNSIMQLFNQEKIAIANNINISVNNVLKVNMTGVTAITRGLLSKARKSGNDAYPSTKIAEFLKSANFTHISNEISFASNCAITDTRFCSDEDITVATLQESGVDIVELTGNHNNDWGFAANTNTLKKYTELGISYFGGGLNSTEASKILYKELNGTKLAFLGYNYYDTVHPSSALASATNPGANSFSFDKIARDIKLAHDNGAFAIVDVQYQECYSYPDGYVYFPTCYQPVSGQETDFRKIIDLGADMVIGTQAHQPQTFEIYKGKPIFYGLGNLFFDQVNWPGTQHGFILTNYYFQNKLIQTKLTTTNYGADMQTYITTGVESEKLLNYLKQARTAL